ncbi:MAG: tetratricopeptide repeat protein [bacterium]
MGISQFYAGNIEAAKEATEKALEMGYSYSNNLSSIFYLAQLSEKLKDYDMAIKSYEEILRLRPNDYDIQFTLAKIYKEKGNIEKAKELAQQVVKSAPEAKAKEAAEFMVGLGGMDFNK